jgi:transposase
MSAEALYRAMGLKGYDVEDTWEGGNGALFVLVSVPRESLQCRKCRCRRFHLHEHRNRFWKSAPLGLTPVIVAMRTPRVKCLSCGSKTWHQPSFAEGQRQVTKEFERCLEAWLSRLTIQDVVETFGVSWNTACDIDLRRLKKLSRPKLAGLRRDLYRELKDQLHREVLKGIRWLLLKNPENLQKNDKVDEQARLQEALKLNEPLAIAYYLKDELRQFWKQPSKQAAGKFLEDWCRRANATGSGNCKRWPKRCKATGPDCSTGTTNRSRPALSKESTTKSEPSNAGPTATETMNTSSKDSSHSTTPNTR